MSTGKTWNRGSVDGVLSDRAWEALRLLGNHLVRDVRESMRTTPRQGGTPRKGQSAPSQPGHPPAVQTGNLLASVIMDDSDRESNRVRVGVSTRAPYGEYLEGATGSGAGRARDPKTGRWISGGRRRDPTTGRWVASRKKRPFLAPALKRLKKAAREVLRQVHKV